MANEFNSQSTSSWRRVVAIAASLAVFGFVAIYVSSKTSNVPTVACPGQQFDVGYASFDEFVDASPSVVLASLDSTSEKKIKGDTVSYPRFRVLQEIKGNYSHEEEIIEVCPVISRNAYSRGEKAVIFLKGKDKNLNLWAPTLGATGMSGENDEGKFTVFGDKAMTIDEIRKAIKEQD